MVVMTAKYLLHHRPARGCLSSPSLLKLRMAERTVESKKDNTRRKQEKALEDIKI